METGVWMITPRAYNCEYILMASIERIVNKDLEVVTGMVGQKHATTCKHAQKDPTFSQKLKKGTFSKEVHDVWGFASRLLLYPLTYTDPIYTELRLFPSYSR